MNSFKRKFANIIFFIGIFTTVVGLPAFSQNDFSRVEIEAVPAGGVVKMLSAEHGFGGGNVAASVGPDGILLVDNMYEAVTTKLILALKKLSDAAIRFVVNTHYHADHIQGNNLLSASTTIIAHENVLKRLNDKSNWATAVSMPQVTFTDTLKVRFNGEDILLFHLPNGHTDGDVFVYFPASKVIHMGDCFFNGMFPAVYKSGGGSIFQMISNIEKILTAIPGDLAVIPGHGKLAARKDLVAYLTMLKETTSIVERAIKEGKTVKEMQEEKLLRKYDYLGNGGAQSTDEYIAMLFGLLSN